MTKSKFQIKSKIQIFKILLASCLLLLVTSSAYAVDYLPIVPCGRTDTPECTTCHFFQLGQNVVNFFLQGLLPPLATLFFIIAGALILLSGANQKLYSRGKEMFRLTVIGLLIIFSSYLLVTTILKALAPDDISENWNKITCTAVPGQPLPVKGVEPSAICSDPEALASQNNVPSLPQNDPELNTLIVCIKDKLPGEELGSEFTFEENNKLCNYTRGQEICGNCAHTSNSCHYGGAGGTEGALSVDFSNAAIGDKIIKAAEECGAKVAWCEENGTGKRTDCSEPDTHVHITAKTCDRN